MQANNAPSQACVSRITIRAHYRYSALNFGPLLSKPHPMPALLSIVVCYACAVHPHAHSQRIPRLKWRANVSLVQGILLDSVGMHIRTLETASELAEFEQKAKAGEVTRHEVIRKGKVTPVFTWKAPRSGK